ncbi:MAG TPA: translation initiation factor IF-2 [Candidatus Baltobacteraceae bacterium]|nr:translation initiation factor IF-2 [Candidatus Baltobacteraceae bacterium]
MATGKVRIFELAKEVGLTSKELITLFNERLGGVFEAKNQLSVVPDHIADLVRGVLLKPKPKAAAAPKAAPTPAAEAAPAVSAAPKTEAKPKPAPKPAAPEEPIPTLKPVTGATRRAAAPKAKPAAEAAPAEAVAAPAEPVAAAAPPVAEAAPAPAPPSEPTPAPEAKPAPAPAAAKPAAPPPKGPETPPAQKPAAAAKPAAPPTRPRPIVPPAPPAAPVQRLRPVPAGQSSVLPPRRQAPPPTTSASASPGPQTGMPGRPGVAPRPGQPGVTQQQASAQAPAAPGQPRVPQPGRLISPAPARPRVQGNGPFRPLPPGARPFTPRAPGAPTSPTDGPAPSSGSGRPGDRSRHFDDKLNKKDREKELLLEKERNRKKRIDAAPVPAPAKLETIEIPDLLTVQELATSMIIPAKDVIKELIKMGTMATINQNIPSDVAISVAKKFGFNAVVKEAGEEVTVEQEEDKPEMMSARPPVVTVLGHVDHGKTSLLDKIRSADVAAGEAGGITQRIGAYTVEKGDRKITFIDTPGHEAFTQMRARGAKVTDVAILVVAADDGVMPQTKEAIAHVKAANVPIVVAINKMDKADAQPERVKQQLAENGLQSVDWGGTIEMVPVSARNGEGIDSLLETVLLEADIRDLKANKTRRATGVVIESALDRGRGAVATVLVQNGTLRVGDIVVVGGTFGKVRALVDDKGKQVKKAGPSIPVEVMGLQDVPAAGDTLMVVSDERVARETAEKRKTRRRDVRISASGGQRISLETFMSMPAEGKKTLNIIVKADGQGSVEALRARMESLSTEDVEIRVIHGGVGAITPNDVNLASASNAVLIGFNIRPDETVKRLAENEAVDLRFYQVIYEVEDDLKKAMRGMLAPVQREVTLGHAEVREVFKVSKVGTIAGCYVKDGKIQRGSKVRVLRDQAVIFDGELESLRRFKDDVKEVAEGYECGIQVAKYQDLKAGDIIEAYTIEMVAAELANA